MKKWLVLVVAMAMPAVLAGCAAGLHQAAKKGDVAALKKQLATGADIDESDFAWGSPLAYASVDCKPEAVRYLLERGANPEVSRSLDGMRPLHWAAYVGCSEAVRLLLDAGADVNAKADSAHQSPLYFAVKDNSIDRWFLDMHGSRDQVAKYLIAHGADLEEAIALSRTAVDSATVTPILERYRQEAIGAALKKALDEKKEREQARLREIENADLAGLLDMRPEKGSQVEALTRALIRAKNTQLPGFLANSSVAERVNLLTTVELRISEAQTLMARLNAQAEDAVRQGQSAAPLREEAGKVQTYAGILAAIRGMLLES